MPHPDSTVLLGYVHSRRHHLWIVEHRFYNVRADVRAGALPLDCPELQTELVLLYGRALPAPELWTRQGAARPIDGEAIGELGYEAPLGTVYHLLPLGEQLDLDWEGVVQRVLRRLGRQLTADGPLGQPVATIWGEVVETVGDGVGG